MSNDEYWPYARAMTELKRRLQATDEEIRMWVFIGSAEGGLDAFDAPHRHEKGSPPRLHFTAPVVGAYFQREQIESFSPDTSRRYINGPQLLGRWAGHGLPQHEALLGQLIDQGDLQPIVLVRTEHDMQTHERDGDFSDLALFALDQVIEVEAREFPDMWAKPVSLAEGVSGVDAAEPAPVSTSSVRVHSTARATGRPRGTVMTPVLECARKNAGDPENSGSVWAALTALARGDSPPVPVVGFVPGKRSKETGVKYVNAQGDEAIFSRDALDQWLKRRLQNP